jgi:hypothetical protein
MTRFCGGIKGEKMSKHITSHEYKLMLNADRFQDREKGIKAFWNVVMYVVKKTRNTHEVKTRYLEKPAHERLTWYMDTHDKDFNAAGWVLRKREEEKKGKKKFKTTLKYRSADIFISASKNLSARAKKSETKFEEDVVPIFSSKFSHSTSFETEKDVQIEEVRDVVKLFPGFKELNLGDMVNIRKVNGFTAREVVYHIGNFRVGDDNICVNCCISFWYLKEKRDMYPLVAEFSFDYDRDEKAGFPVHVCKAAKRIFSTLQKQGGWVDLSGTTKTSFAYSGF